MTQRQLIHTLSEKAGGLGKLATLINKPIQRVSEWHNEKHKMPLPLALLALEKLNLKIV